MKATLEFDLPEEQEELDRMLRAGNTELVLWNLSEHLRQKLKYEDLGEQEAKIYEDVRGRLFELLADHEVTID